MDLAGLVLCGGSSRRMGRDKALMVVEGEALVTRVARRIGSVAAPVLLASGRAGRLGPPAALGLPDVVEVDDAIPEAGPLAGIAAGLAASPHPWVAVVAVDLPFASPSVVRLLALAALSPSGASGVDVVVPSVDGRVQPLHAVWSASAAGAVNDAVVSGVRAVHDMLDRLSVEVVDEAGWSVADPEGRFALNVNRAEDIDGLGLGIR